MPAPAFALTSCLYPAPFDHAGENVAGLRVSSLHYVRQLRGGCPALPHQFRKHLQFREAEWRPLLILLLKDPPCHGQVGRPSRQDGNDMGVGASSVVGRWPTDPELFCEHPVDPAPCTLHQAGAFERICKQRAPWMRWRYEEVVQGYPAREASGAGDLQLFLAPLHVDGAALGVVPVDESIGESLAESSRGIGGYRYAEQSELQLFLAVPSLKPGEHLLGKPQQRVRQKIVDFDLESPEHLECRLVCRQEAPQRLDSPEQEERSRRDLSLGP